MPPRPSMTGPPSDANSFSNPAIPSAMPCVMDGSCLRMAPVRWSASLEDR